MVRMIMASLLLLIVSSAAFADDSASGQSAPVILKNTDVAAAPTVKPRKHPFQRGWNSWCRWWVNAHTVPVMSN